MAADAVVVVHLLFIGLVVFGSFLTWRWPKVAWVHVPVAVYGAHRTVTRSVTVRWALLPNMP